MSLLKAQVSEQGLGDLFNKTTAGMYFNYE